MHIRPATIGDISAIADLSMASLANDEIIGLHGFCSPYGHRYPLSWREGFVRRRKRSFYQHNMTLLNMVTDPSDTDWTGAERIVGHVAMSSTKQSEQPPLSQRFWLGLNNAIHKAEDFARWYLRLDLTMSYPNMNAYLEQQKQTDPADCLKPKDRDHHFCGHLIVSPDHQRRGIGRALIRHAQERAAMENVPILLESSSVGEKFYLSCGFREIARLPFAEGSGIVSPVMLWEPPKDSIETTAQSKLDA